MTALPRLVVFSDDWGRHPSSSQHLVREFLSRYEVDWVNTIGTRRPGLRTADLKRALEKVRAWTRQSSAQDGAEGMPPNLTVHAPIHWPGFGSKLERAINASLFDSKLRPLIERAQAVITTAPITADLAARTRFANWVYYCVDDLSEWPGLDAQALRSLEVDLLPSMKTIIAVSPHLVERMQRLGREARLLTHGIDLEHWRSTAARPPRGQRAQPVVVYWGNADKRLDTEIVLALARACELHMVGPRSVIDPRIANEPGIVWPGAVPYSELPRIARAADVLVMPYADLPVTRAMQPLKLKEYLATGLPVVATPLPANVEWSAALDIESDPRAFVERVRARAFADLPPEQIAARRRLEDEGWDQKAVLFERWIRRS